MPRPTTAKRNQVIVMVSPVVDSSLYSHHFHCSSRSIQRLKKRLDQKGLLEVLKRIGRPLSTRARKRRETARQHRLSPQTFNQIQVFS